MTEEIGFYKEMQFINNCGSIKDFLVDNVDYDKKKVIDYLKSGKLIAGCPRAAFDCITKEKLSNSFLVYTDGEYDWCDFLMHHIEKYNIILPQKFIDKIKA